MKKLLCLSLALFAALSLAFSEDRAIALRGLLPIDFGGTFTKSVPKTDTNLDSKMGLGIGVEAMFDVWQGLKVGAGVQFGFGRGIDDASVSEDAKFGFTPVYGLLAYGFDLGPIYPYAIARIGYNIATGNDEYKNDNDLTGGACFSIGGGVSLKLKGTPLSPFAEINYAYNSGGLQDVKDYSVSYKRTQLCVGTAYIF